LGDEAARRVIDARPIVFPAVVGDMNSVRVDFAAPIDAVEELVPTDVLEVVDFGSGTAFVSFILTHYVAVDWGSFSRASIVASVRPRGAAPADPGLYTCLGATSERFPNEVLYWVLGMHHVDIDLDVEYHGDEVRFSLGPPGGAPLRVGAPLCDPPPVEIMTTGNVGYSVLDGALMRTHYDVSSGAGAVDAARVTFSLGDGPLGHALHDLGLPTAPASWYSGRHMRMVLHEPFPHVSPGELRTRTVLPPQ